MMDRLEVTRRLAQFALHHCAAEGACLAAWRDDVLRLCRIQNVAPPDDYLRWATDGIMTDTMISAEKDGWTRRFRLARIN